MLKIGSASHSIVPDRPAMVQGQMHVRIGRTAMDPLTTTAVAFQGDKDCVIAITLDIALISDAMMQGLRRRLKELLPAVPSDSVFMNATHTHTSLVTEPVFYPAQGPDVMSPEACRDLAIERSAEAAVEAWQKAAPARIARAYGHAVVAHNRRPAYADGHSQMYGRAAQPDFSHIEGTEDHSLDMLFAWDGAGRLAGLVLNIPCPSQVDEGLTVWSADYWHEIRTELRRRLGQHLWVLPQCGAGGDQSPHFILDDKLEAEMRNRRGISERQEIAIKVADEVERALACTKPVEGDVPLRHSVKRVKLTPRGVSRVERDWSQAEYERCIQSMGPESWWPKRLKRVVGIHDGTVKPDPVPVELHFVRIGDAVMATNPFELYTDFGHRIKARSAAAQTFVVQLAAGLGWYLPTARAVAGGSYGAIPAVCDVGPEGGQELVEHSLQAIAELFPKT